MASLTIAFIFCSASLMYAADQFCRIQLKRTAGFRTDDCQGNNGDPEIEVLTH